MGRVARGSVQMIHGTQYVRITFDGGRRRAFALSGHMSKTQAIGYARRLAKLSADLRASGNGDRAERLAEYVFNGRVTFDMAQAIVDALATGKTVAKRNGPRSES
jgi:hypothetical protein